MKKQFFLLLLVAIACGQFLVKPVTAEEIQMPDSQPVTIDSSDNPQPIDIPQPQADELDTDI